MDRALATLDAEAREVLTFRDLEGLSGEETAQALGLSVAAMKSRLHRARLALVAAVKAGEAVNTAGTEKPAEQKGASAHG